MSDDEDIWQQIADSVKPIEKKEKAPKTNPRKIIEISHAGNNPTPRNKDGKSFNYIHEGDIDGVDKSTAKKLKSGSYPIDSRIDLHGMTQDNAFDALKEFIINSYQQGFRCVLVVTGKGKEGLGILFNNTPKWLNSSQLRPYIIMYNYATIKDGGQGALYVLIKRKRNF